MVRDSFKEETQMVHKDVKKKKRAVSLVTIETRMTTSLRQARMPIIKKTKRGHISKDAGEGLLTYLMY